MIKINDVKFMLGKASPEILIGVGIAGCVIATVAACKATLKVENELDKTQDEIEKAHEIYETEGEKVVRKHVTSAYIRGGVRIVRLYAPSAFIGALSIGTIVKGYDILNTRNLTLYALCETMDQAHKAYQNRVISAIGEEAERKLRYDVGEKDIEYIHVDEEGNEKKKSKKKAEIASDNLDCSPYARYFDEGCINWTKSPTKNLYFLRIIQAQANDMLNANGHLFLNEVYDMLGIPRTEDGQLVGWFRGGNDVDFGIYNLYKEANREFVNGYEPTILLDFNVDGLIYNKL